MIEAQLVEDEPSLPVFDAVVVRANSSDDDNEPLLPWWKRHQCFIFLTLSFFVAALIAILGASLLVGRTNGNAKNTPPASSSEEPAVPSRFHSTSPTSSPSIGSLAMIPMEGSPQVVPTPLSESTATTHTTLTPITTSTPKPTMQTMRYYAKELVPGEVIIPHNSTRSVAVYDNIAVIGAPENNSQRGAVFVFVRDESGQWSEHAKLHATDGVAQFGWSVAVYGEYIVVGAVWEVSDQITASGSAHVFVWNGVTWTHQAKLLAPNDGASYDYFGLSVRIQDGIIIVGAYGSVHAFVRSGVLWTHQAKIRAPDGDAEEYFGGIVGVYGDTVVVGAHGDDHNGLDSGSAHVYVRSGSKWTHQEKLLAPDGATGDEFGYYVGIYMRIHTGNDDDYGSNSGMAHIHVRNGAEWSHEAKLAAPDATAGDGFGICAGLYGDRIVVGAWGDYVNGLPNSGSAHVYVRNREIWTHQTKLLAPVIVAGTEFGYM
ncbi:hypothetical protein ACHAWF_011310, partial [Thalassiosira exigua]